MSRNIFISNQGKCNSITFLSSNDTLHYKVQSIPNKHRSINLIDAQNEIIKTKSSAIIYFRGIDKLQCLHLPLDIKKPKIGIKKNTFILL